MFIGGFKMGDNTLGERHSGMTLDIIPMTLSLWSAEVSLTWALSWALDRYVWIRVGPWIMVDGVQVEPPNMGCIGLLNMG